MPSASRGRSSLQTVLKGVNAAPRQMPATVPEFEYPSGFESRRVHRDGSIKWDGGYAFVGEAMAKEIVGLVADGDGIWRLHLGPLVFGVLHERSRTVVALPPES